MPALKVWNSTTSQWVTVGGGGGGTEIPYQNDAPATPADGDIWIDKDAFPSTGGSLLVAESIVSGSAATSITFSGLDGVVDGGYRLIGEFVTASSATNINAFLNGDTTTTNYQSDWIAWDTSVSGSTANSPYVGYYAGPSVVCTLDMELYVMPGVNTYFNTVIKSFCNNFSSFATKTADSRIYNVVHNSAANNLTTITLTATTSGSFAVGSVFRLYRRK